MKKRVYLDYAAATYMDPRVKKAMDNFFIKDFGNPSSLYFEARKARRAVDLSRSQIAKIINAKQDEIIFTNGGTESDNLAILGVAGKFAQNSPFLKDGHKGKSYEKANSGLPHIITAKFEHHAVLGPCKFLEKQGFDVTYLDIGEDGIVKLEDVEKALQPYTILVSIMYANNEIGTIQPIAEIGEILKNHRAVFHTDACQAAGYLDLNVEKLGVDLMTVNGSKIYGPKGIGFLYAKRGIRLAPLMHGGEQERGLRPGTENVPAIVGLAKALELVQKQKTKESKRLTALRDYFIKRLTKEIPKTFLNGHSKKRLPNNINISILGVEGEAVVLYLDDAGIACSTGSACSSERLEPSHVIMAIRNDYAYSHGSIRFSLGKINTKKDIDYVMKILPKVVEKLRTLSATWQK